METLINAGLANAAMAMQVAQCRCSDDWRGTMTRRAFTLMEMLVVLAASCIAGVLLRVAGVI